MRRRLFDFAFAGKKVWREPESANNFFSAAAKSFERSLGAKFAGFFSANIFRKFFVAAAFTVFAAVKIRKVLVAVIFFSIAASANAQSSPLQMNDSERQLFVALNRERAAQSLPALQWDAALFKAARQHALLMSNLNEMEHRLPNEPALAERVAEVGARFSVVAENIAIGPSADKIHNGWMSSPGHRANILDARVTSVGIAAVRGTGGLWAVEDFALSVSNFSFEEQEKKVAALLAASGWHVIDLKDEARKACERNEIAPGKTAKSLVRFETPDLTKLPDDVQKILRNKPFRNAEVGACPEDVAKGFTRFRIAILLF